MLTAWIIGPTEAPWLTVVVKNKHITEELMTRNNMNDVNDQDSESTDEPRPIQFPCLLWEPSLDAVVMCNEQGVGMVLRGGRSTVLKMGMIVPYAASRWCIGGEDWDFILPPPELRVTLRNVAGVDNRPIKLGVDVRNLPEGE